MALYGGPTPKRHLGYSNSSGIRRLDLGALQGWAKKVRSQEAAGIQRVKTVHKYQDKSGKVRYKGSKHLKSSESESQLVVDSYFVVLHLRQHLIVSHLFGLESKPPKKKVEAILSTQG